jgi:fructose-specific phosphotransferase system IIA component
MSVTIPVFGIDLEESSVRVFDEGVNKHDALDQLVDAVAESGFVTDREAFREAVHDRERVLSTGIGHGVAIPHVRIEAVSQPTIGIGVSSSGIDFDTLDDEPVFIVFMFAMPTGSQKEYLGLLSKVMQAVKEPDFKDRLTSCKTPAEVLEALGQP